MTNFNKVRAKLANNDLGMTAWGLPKVSLDYSLFSGLWTFNVVNRVWLNYLDTGSGYVEQPVIDAKYVNSHHGHLQVIGDATADVSLTSLRHLRYQPNRGLIYSTATILPNANDVGVREFGMMTNEHYGMFFRLVGTGSSWTLYAVKRTTFESTTSEIVQDLTDTLPEGFDPEKGNTYDIQMQWRGVGDYIFSINLEFVHVFEFLGTLTELSIENPALSVTFCVHGAATDLKILCGCVDVSSEGGYKYNKIPSFIGTGKTLLPTTNAGTALLAIRLPTEITYEGNIVPYTRDLLLSQVKAFCKDEYFISVLVARNISLPNLNAISWNNATDTFYQWKDNSDGTLDAAFQLDKANMVDPFVARQERDFSVSLENVNKEDMDFYVYPGSTMVVEIQSDGNSTGGVTLSFAEEI